MPSMSVRRFVHLTGRAWPFIRPMLRHIVVFLTIGAASAIFVVALWAVAGDLLTNKVLVGERLQPLQAALLGVGDEYVTASAAQEAPLSVEQRKIVRDRLLIWFGIGGLVFLGGLASLPYYETWIRHHINQNLRVAMIERGVSPLVSVDLSKAEQLAAAE